VLLSRRRLAGISTFTLRCFVVDGRLDELCDMMVFEDKIFGLTRVLSKDPVRFNPLTLMIRLRVFRMDGTGMVFDNTGLCSNPDTERRLLS